MRVKSEASMRHPTLPAHSGQNLSTESKSANDVTLPFRQSGSLPFFTARCLKAISNEIGVRCRFSLPFLQAFIARFRCHLALGLSVAILYLAGQTFLASAIAAGSGLYLINTGIDKHFGAALDRIQKRGAK